MAWRTFTGAVTWAVVASIVATAARPRVLEPGHVL